MADGATHERFLSGLRAWVAFSLAIMVLAAPLGAQAARKSGKAAKPKARTGEQIHSDGPFVTGVVEVAGPGHVSFKGHRFDVSRARFVRPDGKSASAAELRQGTKVTLMINEKRVYEVVVYPPMARE